ncbi:MAG: type I 3-dehydroquinate dehydratase, partial [Spirochaetaceae bacterium]|nr:type I 3-dehydroquinate dehydratase [Spirochaetaceae bacterium]
TLEEACRTFGTRIIRSCHSLKDVPKDLDGIWERISQEEDEIPKLAVTPANSAELSRFLNWSSGLPQRDRLLVAIGDFGVPVRILAGRLGSLFTYSSIISSNVPLAAPGQLAPQVLNANYRIRETDDKSDCYMLLGGKSVVGSLSPFLHSRAFRDSGKDALMVPLPSDSIQAALDNMRFFRTKGAAITAPFKEEVLPFLTFQSVDVQKIGACNTLVFGDGTLAGYNTDADGFERSALEFLGRSDFRGLKVTLLGAGGAAKSVALALYRKGAECIILNRTISTARALARKYGFRWGPLDDRAIDLITEYSDLIVQATSVGMQGGIPGDPLAFYEFDGHEKVYDLVYRPAKTTFLKRAEAASCQVSNGYRMLCYQGAGQYRIWMGEEPPDSYIAG